MSEQTATRDIPEPKYEIVKTFRDEDKPGERRVSHLIKLGNSHYFRTLDQRYGKTEFALFSSDRLERTTPNGDPYTFEQTVLAASDEEGELAATGILYVAPRFMEPQFALYAIGEV